MIRVIIQARMTSTRLPGKVLLPAQGRSLLDHMVDRLSRMKTIDGIIVATTENKTDDPIEELTQRRGIGCFRGSEEDVLDRVLRAARHFKVDVIVETTADCPVIDPVESDKVVRLFQTGLYDYVSNAVTRTYPRGMDTQVFSTKTLEDVARRTQDPVDHEHVSFFIYQHPEIYRLGELVAPPELKRPDLRLTVDTAEDFELVHHIFKNFWPQQADFSLKDMIQFLKDHPDIAALNQHIEQKKVGYA